MSNEQQRAELHRTIWKIADDLRGSVDGWEFKSYVLGTLFYRYISESMVEYVNRLQAEAGEADFDYTLMSDEEAEYGREQIVEEKGYFILPSHLFANVAKRADDDENLNETLSAVFRGIEASAQGQPSEDDLRGLFGDFLVDSTSLGRTVTKRNELLAKVLKAVAAMDLGGSFADHTIDAFGDAYEFLMQMYAASAGKSGGEYFTPPAVSELLARLCLVRNNNIRRVYDPACGSGSLLLKFAKTIGRDNPNLQYYGQEINPSTYNLCRINMFLHGISFDNFEIELGDTLTEPKHLELVRDCNGFDAIVSNPPYSIKWEGEDNPILINDERYTRAGVLAPKSKADLAFTMHMLHHLSESGVAAIVEFPGVLYRGGTEQKIRKYLLDNNYVDAVIQLPSNLFFGVGIATCIIVLRKGTKTDNSVLFVDASGEFEKEGNKNFLRPQHQDRIAEAIEARVDEPYFCRLVKNEDIIANDCNLSVSSYVEQPDTRERIDIAAVNGELADVVVTINKLRQQVDDIAKQLELFEGIEDVEWKELGDLGSFENIGVDKKIVPEEPEVTLLNYMDVYKNKYITKDTPTMKVTAPLKKVTACNVIKGDIFITPTSETREDIGHSAVAIESLDNVVYSYHIMRYRLHQHDMITSHYINYLFDTCFVKEQIYKYATGLTRFGLSKDKFSAIRIPYPSIAIQEEIVKKLDSFEQLSLSIETEIKLRKKQYEYYRNQLLTFE